MIKYFGFNKINVGLFFGFTSSTDSGGGGSNTGGNPSGNIIYLSFPLTRTSAGRDISALPLTMIRINPNYMAEQAV